MFHKVHDQYITYFICHFDFRDFTFSTVFLKVHVHNLKQYICHFDFRDYLRELVANEDLNWYWQIGAAPWEPKVQALLPFVRSPQDKAVVIYEAVKVV